MVRYWLEWYFSASKILLQMAEIKTFINKSNFIENQAFAAMTSKTSHGSEIIKINYFTWVKKESEPY